MKVCFSADIHGNTDHLRRILRCATEQGCETVVLGGDLGPRGRGWGHPSEKKRIRDILPHNNDGSIAWDHADCLTHMQEGFDRQGQWFVEEMMPLLEAHRTTVYIMPGNSDWKHHFQPGGTLDTLPSVGRAYCDDECNEFPQDSPKVMIINGEGQIFTLRSTGGGPCVPALALSLVPISSHRKKDWERKDWRWQEEQQLEPGASLDGFVSSGHEPGYVKRKRLSAKPGWDGRLPERSIETALDEALRDDGEAPGIWFVHCPPRHTVGDLTSRGERVGSVALRAAIERHTPMATFHGHIHESVDQHDGMFKEHIATMKRAPIAGGNAARTERLEETISEMQRKKMSDDMGARERKPEEEAERTRVGASTRDRCTVVSVGNDFRAEAPHVIVFDTDDPGNAVRVKCA